MLSYLTLIVHTKLVQLLVSDSCSIFPDALHFRIILQRKVTWSSVDPSGVNIPLTKNMHRFLNKIQS